MECPRCGGTLTRYRLDERETVGCQSCEYVGVPVDHTAPNERAESWDDAIDRFQEQSQSVTVVRRDDSAPTVPESEPPAAVVEVDGDQVDEADWVVPVFDEADTASEDDWVVPVFDEAEAADETGPQTADAGD